MTDNLVANALKRKRQGSLTPTELQQLNDLKKVYGIHNVLMAIHFAKTTQIKDIGKILLQHCGFRSNLAASLKDVIPDKEAAKHIYPSEKYLAGCRLEEATKPVEPELERHAKTLWLQWKTKFSVSDMNQASVTYALKVVVRAYGVAFAQTGIDILSKAPRHTENDLILLYKAWLELASSSSSSTIQLKLKEMGIPSDNYNWKIPQPLPFRLEKYFIAKANRQPTDEEKARLWAKSRKRKIEEIIHAMSCIPSGEFSIEKIEHNLSLTEPFGVELVAAASIKKKTAIDVLFDEEDDDDSLWEDGNGEIQPPHDPMRDSDFYDYSRFDENALDGEDYLDDYLIDEDEPGEEP